MTADRNKELLAAAAAGETTRVMVLLSGDVNPNCRNSDGDTPLVLACRNSLNNQHLAAYLISHGADVNLPGAGGETPLHAARNDGDCRVVEALLNAHANPLARDNVGRTPLHRYFEAGFVSGALMLIDRFYRPALLLNAQDNDGNTPMHTTGKMPPELLLQMIGHGADTTMINQAGLTPADVAPTDLLRRAYRAQAALIRTRRTQSAVPVANGVSEPVSGVKTAVAALLAADAVQSHAAPVPQNEADAATKRAHIARP